MEITKNTLKELFKEYNEKYFNGVLSTCKMNYIKISCLGRYTYKKDKDGKIIGTIWITNDVDWSIDALRQVIVHEMIHHYVKTIDKELDLFFGHGKSFKKQMKRINEEFNIGVSIYSPHIKKKSRK